MGNVSDQLVAESEARTAKLIAILLKQIEKIMESADRKITFWGKTRNERVLLNHLKEGKMLVPCTDKVDPGRFAFELEKAGIARLCTTNGKVLIKEDDIEKASRIAKRLIIESGRYYQSVSIAELSNAVANSNGDKTLFRCTGLDKYQVESLKNKCNDIKKGFTVGIEKESDGTFDLAIKRNELYREPRLLTSGKIVQDKDFARAYLESTLSLYGPNRENKIRQMDADEEFDNKMLDAIKADGVFYVISVDDPSKFIKITNYGYTPCYSNLNPETGEFTIIEDHDHAVLREHVGFRAELQRETDGYYNKALLDNEDDLHKHLSTKARNIPTDRPGLSGEMYAYAKANKELVDVIDKIAREEVASMSGLTVEQKFIAYTKCSQEILESIALGETIDCSQEDREKIESILSDKQIDRENYKTAAQVHGNLQYKFVNAKINKDVEAGVKEAIDNSEFDRN